MLYFLPSVRCALFLPGGDGAEVEPTAAIPVPAGIVDRGVAVEGELLRDDRAIDRRRAVEDDSPAAGPVVVVETEIHLRVAIEDDIVGGSDIDLDGLGGI